MWSEFALNLLIEFVGVGHFRNQTHDDLSSQRKIGPQRGVAKFLQRKPAKLFDLPGGFTKRITREINRLERAQQSMRLIGRRLQFHLCGQLQQET